MWAQILAIIHCCLRTPSALSDRVHPPGRKATRVRDLVKIDAEGAEIGIVAGMGQMIARDRPAIVLEFNAARYTVPADFLNLLLASYGDAQEMTLDGNFIPLDFASITDRSNTTDRFLMFGLVSSTDTVDEPAETIAE